MHYGEEVEEFVRSNGVVTKVRTKNGLEIPAECYGVGFGLTMNTEIVDGTPIQAGKNGILCNDHLETSVPGIYAAGDIADFYDPISRCATAWERGTMPGAHGRVVARNMIEQQ